LGTVGLNWQTAGFADFNGDGMTDMMLRNSSTGGFEVYNIANNSIVNAAFVGTVGLNWQFSGLGNFSGLGESDMLLRNANTGGLEVYDIANNAITNATFIGTIGLDWQFSGVGNFSGVPGETDLLLRNINTGGLEVYDINNNQLTNAAFIGTIGLEWQFAGIAPVHAAGASDLVLRNVSDGGFRRRQRRGRDFERCPSQRRDITAAVAVDAAARMSAGGDGSGAADGGIRARSLVSVRASPAPRKAIASAYSTKA
jgi:hypothetical protein